VAAAVTDGPVLVIGLPLYGRGEHLEEALESLLAQTRRDLAVVVTDDARDPAARAVLDGFDDPRVHYFANDRRLGLVGNWRRSFEVARQLYPDVPYFAWASDHDAWHPLWAERLVALLDSDPNAAIAYPKTYRMDLSGWTLRTKDWSFDTSGVSGLAARLRATVRGMSAGNMVYGLYRADALERVGVFPYSLLPDRLLLTALSLHGDLRQVPERLFYRRVTDSPTIERQRTSFWPDGAPAWARAPWVLQHVAFLTMALFRGRPLVALTPRERVWLIVNHLGVTTLEAAKSRLRRLYVHRLMRRRSLRQMAVRTVGRAVEEVSVRPWGPPVLGAARRAADLAQRR
jgi:glycosyltransferase involved in cell wall biosynthesis